MLDGTVNVATEKGSAAFGTFVKLADLKSVVTRLVIEAIGRVFEAVLGNLSVFIHLF